MSIAGSAARSCGNSDPLANPQPIGQAQSATTVMGARHMEFQRIKKSRASCAPGSIKGMFLTLWSDHPANVTAHVI